MKDAKENKYCNCTIPSNKQILKSNINHSFCSKCGSVLIKGPDNNIYYTMKPKQKIKPTELSPIEMIKKMKKKTEEEYPYLNNDYNMNDIEKFNKEKLSKSIDNYLKHRKMIILTLQKMMKMLDFSDLIFYQCLFYIDTYLSHNMTEDMTEKKILYYLVGYFLCSAKLKETDIYEPSLDSFCCLKKKIYLSMDKILYYEVICLKSIKYNIFSYSAYDWISELITIGIVFDCEINKDNSIILINGHRHSILNTISKSAMKMLLNITVKDIFIKYSPMYVAFSLIQISREKYLDKKIINTKLFHELISLYGVNFKDYKVCYKELKAEIGDKKIESKGVLDNEKNENSKKKESDEIIRKVSNDDCDAANTHVKMDKNVVVVNKMKSSTTVIRVKDNLINNKEVSKFQEKKEDKDDKDKEDEENDQDNIIIFDENNNEEQKVENKLCLNDDDDTESKTINSNNNKMRNSLDLAHVKVKNKNRLFIDCKNNVFRSNDNLPKIDLLFDKNLKETDLIKETDVNKISRKKGKRSPTKQNTTNTFLKTNQKTLNPIKNKNILGSVDNKRYFQSNFSNNNSNFKPKEELDSMRRSLFYDNSNNFTKLTAKDKIGILNNKMKSSNVMPVISQFDKIIKEDKKDYDLEGDKNNEEIENNNIMRRNERCKSKGKSKNNLVGKETKTLVANKRNQSTNNKKIKTINGGLDSNRNINGKINIQRKINNDNILLNVK